MGAVQPGLELCRNLFLELRKDRVDGRYNALYLCRTLALKLHFDSVRKLMFELARDGEGLQAALMQHGANHDAHADERQRHQRGYPCSTCSKPQGGGRRETCCGGPNIHLKRQQMRTSRG